jgi:hypothetical protein
MITGPGDAVILAADAAVRPECHEMKLVGENGGIQ